MDWKIEYEFMQRQQKKESQRGRDEKDERERNRSRPKPETIPSSIPVLTRLGSRISLLQIADVTMLLVTKIDHNIDQALNLVCG
jgi:hypothetical protein